MSNYLRPRAPGACVFFTVALAARGSSLLVEEVRLLRRAVAKTRAQRPFHIDAWVVMPDHLHCVWSLPEGDADYSIWWVAIKARFSMKVRRAGSPRRVLIFFGCWCERGFGGADPALHEHIGGDLGYCRISIISLR